MNWKSTWVLLTAAGVMLAFLLSIERPLRRQRELQASRLILPGLNVSAITNIEVRPWGRDVIQAVRQNGGGPWRLVRPVAYPAENQSISSMLGVLSKLEWQDRVSERELQDRPNAQEEFGFTTPRFTLLLQGSASDCHLEVGNLGAFDDTVSLQVVGNNAIYIASADILRGLPADNFFWRDRSLLNLTNLAFQTLRVRAPGMEFDMERDATNHLWFMRKPLLARADTSKINELLARLQSVSVNVFGPDKPQAELESYGLQSSDATPELALSFFDGTNKVAGLQLGRGLTNYPGLFFVRRDDPGNIVVVAGDALKPWKVSYTNFLDQHFISRSPSLVDSISVRGDGDFVVSKQTNGLWQVSDGRSFPADPILMDDWLACLTNVPTEIAKTVVTDVSDYGLSRPNLQYNIRFAPQAGAQAGVRIDFGSNQAGKVFERRLGEDFVNTVSLDDYDHLPRASWQLRDRQVWRFDSSNVVSVTIRMLGGTLKYLRNPADGDWTYAPGYSSQVPVDSPAIEECVYRIGRLRAIFWDGEGDAGLERYGFAKTDFQVEFEVKHGATNEIYRIQFGGRSPMRHPYASVVQNGQRLIFEFPADLYENWVLPNMTLFTARYHNN